MPQASSGRINMKTDATGQYRFVFSPGVLAVGVVVFVFVFTILGCEMLNAPLKDDIDYNLSVYPVTTESELNNAINAVPSGGRGVFTVMRDITISSAVTINAHKTITLEAYAGTDETMRLLWGGPPNNLLFKLENGSLILGTGRDKGTLVLDGGGIFNSSLVGVGNSSGGGNLILNKGAELRNAANGGVHMEANGHSVTFIMNGGTISQNTGACGVAVISYSGSATFTMTGGTISGNNGGGVMIYGSTSRFTMGGGTISENNAGIGGGVYIFSGYFTMSGGTISGNTSSNEGGGVYVGGTFTKTGGTIYGNTGTGNANVAQDGTGNPADTYGHAVYYEPGAKYYCDTTLNGGDNISTGMLPSTPGATLYNWTRKL
ncbi:MAG: autotransporter adhesin family protein [Treponema sp.]|jgi:hypothetical protein|nr:autotransporter adhesin family protein [Treponema sp.]